MLRFIDGFDFEKTADLGLRWNAVGADFTISTTGGRFSSGCLKNTVGGGGEALTKLFSPLSAWVIGFAYSFNLAGKASIIADWSDTGGNQLQLQMSSSNILQLARNGTVIATGTTSLLINTFYYIEWKATFSGSIAANTNIAKLNGVAEINVPAGTSTDAQGTGVAGKFSFHYDQFQITNIWDDLYICDTTGSANNDFLGDRRVETLLPNADGFHLDWAVTGAANAHTAVNEKPEDGDTSYVSSNTVGNKETFTFPALSSTPASVAGVQVTAVVRKDDAGSRTIAPLLRIAATDYEGNPIAVLDSYSYATAIYETNPNTTTAWTGANVNALEAGVQLVL